MKALFNAQYDDKDGSRTFYEEWKAETEHQAQVSQNIINQPFLRTYL